jgi:hypothetical protein
VDAGTMFAKDKTFSLADNVFVLRRQRDMTAAAGYVFDGNNDPVFFVV